MGGKRCPYWLRLGYGAGGNREFDVVDIDFQVITSYGAVIVV